MAVRYRTRATSLALAIAAMMLASTPRGQAQATSDRRGGPRDWSHSYVATANGGLEVNGRDARDWRTVLKHRRMAQSNLLRANAAASVTEPEMGWLAGPEFIKRVRAEDGGEGPTGVAPDLDWSLRTGGYGNVVGYPAKYSLNWDISTYACSDIIYFTVNQNGSATAANVIALTNVYIGCSGNAAGATPTVKFALRLPTGTATSAVPSMDGSILYVFESAAGALILHAIQVGNITTTPGTYNFTAPGNWTTVHALKTTPIGGVNDEQLWQMPFAVTNNASSPFLDYLNNEIYFGDSSGKLHRIVNLATTSPIERTGFPVACGTVQVTSPVYAEVQGTRQVVMGSADGKLYRIDVTGAGPSYSCVASAKQGSGVGVAGGLSTPLVDVGNGRVLYSTGADPVYGYKGLGMMNLIFSSGGDYTSAVATGKADALAPVSAALDDDFWADNLGSLYVPGGSMGGLKTYLVRVAYNGTAVSGPTGYASLQNGGTSSQPTSPVTEFLTASAVANPDFLFVGGAGGSYLFMNRISSKFDGADGASVPMTGSFAVPGGVMSGIGIDTQSALNTGQAKANIYFGTMGVGPSTTQSTIVQLAQQF